MTATPYRVPVLRAGGLSVRVRPRAVAATLGLVAAAVVLGALAMTLGDYQLSVGQVVGALTDTGAPPSSTWCSIFARRGWCSRSSWARRSGWRGRCSSRWRATTSRARTCSASPPARRRAPSSRSCWRAAAPAGTTAGALIGTGVTMLAVQALLGGATGGYRLVLVGIGVNAVLAALNNVLILRADLPAAVAAQSWLVGTLNGRGWTEVLATAIALAVLVPVAVGVSGRLDLLGMGDLLARGVGVTVGRTRVVTLLAGVALVGVATAAVGPVAFVALAAPQLARRLAGTTGPTVVAAGLMGGVLLLAGDVLGQRLVAPLQFPAGAMTAAIGGLYLVWLLAREWRAGR